MTAIQELKDLLTDAVWAALEEGVELSLETADGAKTIVLRAKPAEGEGEGDPVTITAELADIRLTDLDALTQIAGGVSLDVIPPAVPLASIIALHGLEIVVAQSPAREVTSVTLAVQSAEPWEIIEGQFSLEELFFSITVKSPLDPLTREVSCKAKSTLGIGEIALGADVALPAMNVALAIPAGEEAPLRPLLDNVLPDDALPELTLTTLSAEVKPREQRYAFAAAVKQSWEVLPGVVTLTGLGIELAREGLDRPTGKVKGSFTLADTNFTVSASRSGGGTAAAPTPAVWVFEGGTKAGEEVAIGKLVGDLTGKLGIPMPAFVETLALTDLKVKLDQSTGNLSMRGELPSTGFLAIDSRPDLLSPLGKTLIASFSNPEGEKASLRDMLEGVSADLAAIVPEGLTVEVKQALYASWRYPTTATVSKTLFGVDVGAGLDLSQLPLVGQNFTEEQKVKLAYTILIASGTPQGPEQLPTSAEMAALITLFKAQGVTLGKEPLTDGLTLRGELSIGDFKLPLNVPATVNPEDGQIEAPPARSGMDPQWFPLQQSLGPVSLERIGVKFDAGELYLLLDASLQVGPLSLGLPGLSVSAPITMDAPPRFHLDGLALDYRTPSLEIGGSLLRRKMTVGGQEVESYDGLAVLKGKLGAKSVALSAIAGYASFQGEPSLFLYAVLAAPLGGPPFFFVEGLSAGFGVNRALTVPAADKIKDFPLVREALSGSADIGDASSRAAILQEKVNALSSYITPSLGAGFLAVGVKFSSFKILHGFVLVTAALGERFELNVLGLARLTLPFAEPGVPVEPMAQIEMALKATFIPEEGFLGVIAQLTKDSFIFSKDCKLTGGFAFYTWLAGQHAGDFVVTMGGYHPRFEVPDHYPRVPRLGFTWSLGPATLKGEQYFALCPHAVMAGGSMQISYESGDAHASLRTHADFLISWKPYHYDIELGVEISAGYGFLGDVSVGANLRLWGPDFGGYAEIDVFLFSFTIEFGDQSSRYPLAVGWEDFKDNFVPEEVCSIAVTRGLSGRYQAGAEELWVVNPKELALATDAFVPTKKGLVGDAESLLDMGGAAGSFGIRPMAVSPDEFETEQWIKIIKVSEDGEKDVSDWFNFGPSQKQIPSAVWGTATTVDGQPDRILPPGPDDDRFVEGGVVTGFDITIKAQIPGSDTENIDTRFLQYDTMPEGDVFQWAQMIPFQPMTGGDEARREELRKSLGQSAVRDQLLGALGFDPARDVAIDPASLAGAFVVPPQVQLV
ncbi:DUF6603 domain-containing protein [Sorangium sp. So ce1182]|uniref:DUF6603 domain-containing protein n=1 Tax=Sorangium sp. So ce1182 TaxID=3133334 RepID=UPI003F5DC6D9